MLSRVGEGKGWGHLSFKEYSDSGKSHGGSCALSCFVFKTHPSGELYVITEVGLCEIVLASRSEQTRFLIFVTLSHRIINLKKKRKK